MPVIYNENDAYPAQWLRNLIAAGHLPAGDVDERSISDLGPKDLAGYDTAHFFAGIGGWPHALALADWPDLPVWTGSCPCQPFSAAGKRGGHRDERHLWPAWFRLIRECRPPVIFGEQVASKDGLEWLDAVSADLEGEGYAVGASDLCAAGVGAPHIRQRIFFVAYTEGRDGEVPVRERGPLQEGVESGGRGGFSVVAYAERRPTERHRYELGATPSRNEGAGQERERLRPDAWNGGINGAGAVGDPASEQAGRAGQPRQDFWRPCDWLPCRDGKSRPVEPGSFPLAHGSAFKLGSGGPLEGKSRAKMLRAYGNAIVPQAAAEFIGAFMACRP